MVIDASVAAAWYLRSQATDSATALYRRAEAETFVAPTYFSVEIRNVLLLGERRGVLARGEADAVLAKLGLIIELDAGDVVVDAERAMAVARRSGLKLYDAIYLEKAIREGRALASRDGGLLDAASAAGVEVYDARR